MKKNQSKKTRNALLLRFLAGSVVFAFAFTHTEPLGPLFGRRTSGTFTSAMRQKISGFYNTQKMRLGQLGSTYGQKMVKGFDAVSALSNAALTGYLAGKVGTPAALTFGVPALLASSALATASKKIHKPYLFEVPYKSIMYLAGLQAALTPPKTVNPAHGFVKNFTPVTPVSPMNMSEETKSRLISVSKSLGSFSKKISQQAIPAPIKQNSLFKWLYRATTGFSYVAWLLSPKTKKLLQNHPSLTNGARTALDGMKQKPLVSKTCNVLKNSRSLRSTFKFVRDPKVALALYGIYGAFEWARLGKKYLPNIKQYCKKRWNTYKQSEI